MSGHDHCMEHLVENSKLSSSLSSSLEVNHFLAGMGKECYNSNSNMKSVTENYVLQPKIAKTIYFNYYKTKLPSLLSSFISLVQSGCKMHVI